MFSENVSATKADGACHRCLNYWFVSVLRQLLSVSEKTESWKKSGSHDMQKSTYCIRKQQSFKWACTDVQSRQCLCCSHMQYSGWAKLSDRDPETMVQRMAEHTYLSCQKGTMHDKALFCLTTLIVFIIYFRDNIGFTFDRRFHRHYLQLCNYTDKIAFTDMIFPLVLIIESCKNLFFYRN